MTINASTIFHNNNTCSYEFKSKVQEGLFTVSTRTLVEERSGKCPKSDSHSMSSVQVRCYLPGIMKIPNSVVADLRKVTFLSGENFRYESNLELSGSKNSGMINAW